MNLKSFVIIIIGIFASFAIEAKTIIVNPQKPLQKQFSRRATYVIKDNINLQGKSLQIPRKSKLMFDGGSLSNGRLLLNQTTLQGIPSIQAQVEGSIKNTQLKVDWFLALNDLDDFFNSKAYALKGYKELVFSKRLYNVSVRKSADGLQLSNILVSGNNCTIQSKQGGNLTYSVLALYNSRNVVIKDMSILGSNETSDIEGSRHNLCVTKCHNVRLENINTSHAFTDGLYLRDNDNVIILGLNAHDNGRQGCSITSGRNITIEKSSFSGSYRTAPMSGLDIEPSLPNDVVTGISILNCKFFENQSTGMVVFLKTCNEVPNVSILVRDCEFYANNINMSVRSNPNAGTGEIQILNNYMHDSKGASFQSICYSTENTPHVRFVGNRLQNANLIGGKDVRAQAAFISVHNISSGALETDFGNITISDVTMNQAETLLPNIYRGISLYANESLPYNVSGVDIHDIHYRDEQDFEDSYNDYMIYVPRGKHKGVNIDMSHTVRLSKSITKAITPASHFIITGDKVVSLKGQIRNDLFETITIECVGNSKVVDISRDTLYYSDGSVYDNTPIGGKVTIKDGVISLDNKL